MLKVITFGTFDYLHAGHESYLKQAKEHGDYLITVVARDKTVKSIKGTLPDKPEKKRLKAIKALPYVDKAILGHKEDKFKLIRQLKPDIIALGYDQFVFTYEIEKLLIRNKLNAKIVRLKPYMPEINKSSIIKQKCNPVETLEKISLEA